MDTLRFVWRALRAQIPMCWHWMGRCASKHNWPITIYLTAGAWFMNCWLLVGRRWRNRRQRPLVLDMCKCHTKSQWVTVTLTDSSVYLLAGEQIYTFQIYSKYTKENKINRRSLPYKGWYLAHVAYMHWNHIIVIPVFIQVIFHSYAGIYISCTLGCSVWE